MARQKQGRLKFRRDAAMKRHLSSRWLLAIALVAAWLGAVRAAGRSPAVMATAADTFM
jgi:hypothetical protein